jgi:hypothetical protein
MRIHCLLPVLKPDPRAHLSSASRKPYSSIHRLWGKSPLHAPCIQHVLSGFGGNQDQRLVAFEVAELRVELLYKIDRGVLNHLRAPHMSVEVLALLAHDVIHRFLVL